MISRGEAPCCGGTCYGCDQAGDGEGAAENSLEDAREHPAMYDCHRSTALAHPFIAEITDVACGYDDRLTDERCGGCYRQSRVSALDQLREINDRYSADGLQG